MLPAPTGHFSIRLWFDSGLELVQVAKTFNRFLKFDLQPTESGYWIDEQSGPRGWSYVLMNSRPLQKPDSPTLPAFVFSAWFYDGRPGAPINEKQVREYARHLQLRLQRELEIPVLAHMETQGEYKAI